VKHSRIYIGCDRSLWHAFSLMCAIQCTNEIGVLEAFLQRVSDDDRYLV